MALPGREPRGALDDPGADRERAGEGDRVDERVLDERRPGLPFALGDRKRRRRGRRRRAGRRPAARRSPATARPASSRPRCRRRGRPTVIPQRIATGKFQGAITATTPERGVAHAVRLAGDARDLRAASVELDRPRARSSAGSRSPRRRRRRPPATASRTRGPPARRPRAAVPGGSRRRAPAPARARLPDAPDQARRPSPAASVTASSTSSEDATAASATARSVLPGSVETSSSPVRESVADPDRCRERQPRVELGERGADLVADRRPAEVEGRRVDEVAHGRSSKVSRSAVRPRVTRNESFEVFSSSRRTR